MYLAKLARDALLEEVDTTPKPGLVDKNNNGSHTDMDRGTFYRSAEALFPYFELMEYTGKDSRRMVGELFPLIRKIGIQAEKAMFKATGGVNTHKGILFSMGIVVTATSFCETHQEKLTIKSICDVVKEMCHDTLQAEFSTMEGNTHGEKLWRNMHVKGIRGEVMEGFPSVREVALAHYHEGKNKCMPRNQILVNTLLSLMTTVEDSNVLYRNGREGSDYVRAKAMEALVLGGAYTQEGTGFLAWLDNDFIQRNIRPGGSADLLALTILLTAIEEAETLAP